MTLDDLIRELKKLRQEVDGNTIVRLAIQPNWPFEHHIGQVVIADFPDESALDDEDLTVSVIYITDGGHHGYLPGVVAKSLNWK